MYGPKEHPYCEPVAEGLADDLAFARFFLERAKVGDWAKDFVCLKDEQKSRRTKGTKYWWKNVFCHEATCKCTTLKGTEIDILVVFERPDGQRLGLHIECKNPGDKFKKGQAKRYPERLDCWTRPGGGPHTIPQHDKAASLLICDRVNRHSTEDMGKFGGVIYFDEIAKILTDYPAKMSN